MPLKLGRGERRTEAPNACASQVSFSCLPSGLPFLSSASSETDHDKQKVAPVDRRCDLTVDVEGFVSTTFVVIGVHSLSEGGQLSVALTPHRVHVCAADDQSLSMKGDVDNSHMWRGIIKAMEIQSHGVLGRFMVMGRPCALGEDRRQFFRNLGAQVGRWWRRAGSASC